MDTIINVIDTGNTLNVIFNKSEGFSFSTSPYFSTFSKNLLQSCNESSFFPRRGTFSMGNN